MVNKTSNSIASNLRVRGTDSNKAENSEVVSPDKGVGIPLSSGASRENQPSSTKRVQTSSHLKSDVATAGFSRTATEASSPRTFRDSAQSFLRECDAQTNPTTLYKLLEASQWKRASMRAVSHPIEAQTIIVRRDASKNNAIRWRLLPLHAALMIAAPKDVILSLIEAFPKGATWQDEQGMIPLHFATRAKKPDEDIIKVLLKEYPEGINVKDRRGRVPSPLRRKSTGKDTKVEEEDYYLSETIKKCFADAADTLGAQKNLTARSSISPSSPTYTKASEKKSENSAMATTVSQEARTEIDEDDPASLREAASRDTGENPNSTVTGISSRSLRSIPTAVKRDTTMHKNSLSSTNSRKKETMTPSSNMKPSLPSKSDRSISSSMIGNKTTQQKQDNSEETSVLAGELAVISEAHIAQINKIKAEHQNDLADLRSGYELIMKEMREDFKKQTEVLRAELTKDEGKVIEELKEQHDLRLDNLRNSLTKEIQSKQQVNSILREQVDGLEKKVNALQGENDMCKALMGGMTFQSGQLEEKVAQITEAQDHIMDLMQRQKEEREMNHGVTNKIIQTLLAQQEEDRLNACKAEEEIFDLIAASTDMIEGLAENTLGGPLDSQPNSESIEEIDAGDEHSGIADLRSDVDSAPSMQDRWDERGEEENVSELNPHLHTKQYKWERNSQMDGMQSDDISAISEPSVF